MLDHLEISSLVVRAAGLTEAEAHQLVARIGDELHRRLSSYTCTEDRRIPDVAIRITASAPRERWPQLIADQLLGALREVPRA